MKSLIRRHSIIVDGHKISISLEEAFWTASKEIAQERGESLRHLIASINANRQFANLSSAIRLYVLWYYKDKFARQQAMFEQRGISVQKEANLINPRSSLEGERLLGKGRMRTPFRIGKLSQKI